MPKQPVDYTVQFSIISFSSTGVNFPVCFFGPDTAGFSDIETARGVLAIIEKADRDLNRSRVYEIQPVVVSEHYGKAGEVIFDLGEDGDELDEMIEAAERKEKAEDDEPPTSN